MAVTKMRVATTEVRRDRSSGDTQEHTEWHRITLFGRVAEVAKEYLRKGSKVYIEGRLRTSKWQGQDGQDRWTTEVIADQMTMLDSRGGGTAPLDDQVGEAQPYGRQSVPAGTGEGSPGGRTSAAHGGNQPDFDDDIPF
jgi:single-strand DNA-binding protein